MVAAVLVAACSKSSSPVSSGGLEIVVESDMSIPKDIDHVRLDVTQGGRSLLHVDTDAGPGALLIPAFFSVKSDGDDTPVTIQGVAYKSGQVRVERDAVTPIPTGRVGELQLALDYLCVGQAQSDADGGVSSTCPDGLTCVEGACAPSTVPASAVSTYAPGGAGPDGGGTLADAGAAGGCFDVQGCFASATPAAVDSASCVVTLPPGANAADVNVALQLPSGSNGACSSAACWLALTSWTYSAGQIQLPPAACSMANAPGASLVVTTACATEPDLVLPCNAGSSQPNIAIQPPPMPVGPIGQACTEPLSQSCGLCGTQTRACIDGVPSAWSACAGEGVCMAAATQACPVTGATETCGANCQWGPCDCPGGQTSCSGTCLALDTDVHDCGACGNDCTSLPHVSGATTCAAGQCVIPASSCSPGFGDCNGDPADGCEASLSTPDHCGVCAVACTASTVCSTAGALPSCVSACSAAAPILCGGTCTDTTHDPLNCNGCGHACSTSVLHASATCSADVCGFACNAGTTLCGGACVDEQTDVANCGSCGHACPAGATCRSGACACTGPTTQACGNCGTQTRTCASGSWSAWSACGSEGVCAASTTQSCEGTGTQTCSTACQWGSCACPGAQVVCNGACVDEQSDSTSCGGCGAAYTCASGLVCTAGRCVCSGYAGNCPVVLASQSAAGPIAIDTKNVYWMNDGTYNSTTFVYDKDGTVLSVPLSGGAVSTLATAQNHPVAIAAFGGVVYWADGGDTGGSCDGVIVDSTARTWASGACPTSLATDGVNLYWTSYTGAATSRALAGGGATVLLQDSQDEPYGVGYGLIAHVVAAQGGSAYWMFEEDGDTTGWTSGALVQTQASAAQVLLPAAPIGNLENGIIYDPYKIAVDGTYAYWIDQGQSGNGVGAGINRVPLAGGAVVTLVSGNVLNGIATDGVNLYWTDSSAVRRMPVGGGTAVALAYEAGTGIAVDGASVYWTSANGVMKIAK